MALVLKHNCMCEDSNCMCADNAHPEAKTNLGMQYNKSCVLVDHKPDSCHQSVLCAPAREMKQLPIAKSKAAYPWLI